MKNGKNSLKSKGFTLIELLLVAFILSLIAVSTAPLLLDGVNESLSQARKNEFLKAYQNTMTGAQMIGIWMCILLYYIKMEKKTME